MNSDGDSNEAESTTSKIENVTKTVPDKPNIENLPEIQEEVVEPYSPGNAVSTPYFEEDNKISSLAGERMEISHPIEEVVYEEIVTETVVDVDMVESVSAKEEEIPGFGSNNSETKDETNVFESIVNSKKYDIKDCVYAVSDVPIGDYTILSPDDKLKDSENNDRTESNEVTNEESKQDLDERVITCEDALENKVIDNDTDVNEGNKDQDIRQEFVKVLKDNDLKFLQDNVVDNSMKPDTTSSDIDSRISTVSSKVTTFGPFSDIIQINDDENSNSGVSDVDYRRIFPILKNLPGPANWPMVGNSIEDKKEIKDDNSNGSASPVVERKRRRKWSSDEDDSVDTTMRSTTDRKRKNINSRRRYRRRKSSSDEDRRSRSPYKRTSSATTSSSNQYSTSQVVPPAPTISVKKFANRVPSPTSILEVPQAQQSIVRCIETNEMKSINIDGIMREIRYYNYSAVVFIKWDDPRDISFYNGTRSVIFNDIYVYQCCLNSPPTEVVLEGRKISIKLGAPTRELYINSEWYECHFGGPPINVQINDRSYSVLLDGPPPTVNIGKTKRYDLVAGKIFMVIDNTRHSLYLDAKLQRVDVDGCPIVVQFIDSLRKVVLNNVSFPATYDGEQNPFRFMGKVRYFSFTRLPSDVRPGQVNITDMTTEILPPPPSPPFVPDFEDPSLQSSVPKDLQDQPENKEMETTASLLPGITVKATTSLLSDTPGVPSVIPISIQSSMPNENRFTPPILPPPIVPLDMLPELLNMPNENAIQITSDDENERPDTASTIAVEENSNNEEKPQFNLDMLFKRLVDSGIVTNSNALPIVPTKNLSENYPNYIIPVDIYNLQAQYPDVPRQEYLITKMYSGVQCATCAQRYSSADTVRYRNHLDWHFRENRRARDPQHKVQSRELYEAMKDWVENIEEGENWFEAHPEENQEAIEPEKEIVSVAADKEDQSAKCELCHETFEHFYKDEAEEWHLKQAIRVENKLYHPSCYEGHKEPEVDDDVLISEVITETINLDDLTEDGKNSVDKDSQNSQGTVDITKIKEEKEDKPCRPKTTPTEENEVTYDSDLEEVELIEEPIVQIIINDDHDHEPNLEVLNLEDITEASQCKDNENKKEETVVQEDKNNAKEDVAEVTKEKDNEEIVDITHSEISMDGNVELSESLQIVNPSTKIKINIKRSNVSPTPVDEKNEDKNVETENPQQDHPSLTVTHFKPRLSNVELTKYPPVHKGTEISGLCTIM